MENDGDSSDADSRDDDQVDDRSESSTDDSNYNEGKSGTSNSKEESGEEEEEDEVEDAEDNPKGILSTPVSKKGKVSGYNTPIVDLLRTNRADQNVTLGSLGGNPVIRREEEEKIGIELVAPHLMIIIKVSFCIVIFIIMCHS
jgi:hypothetical protein